MSGKFVVKSDSYGECVYLRMFGRGRYGSKFGLVRSPAEATAFSFALKRARKPDGGNVIMRAFNTVELMRPRRTPGFVAIADNLAGPLRASQTPASGFGHHPNGEAGLGGPARSTGGSVARPHVSNLDSSEIRAIGIEAGRSGNWLIAERHAPDRAAQHALDLKIASISNARVFAPRPCSGGYRSGRGKPDTECRPKLSERTCQLSTRIRPASHCGISPVPAAALGSLLGVFDLGLPWPPTATALFRDL